MSRKVRVTIDLTVDDDKVADYIVEYVAAGWQVEKEDGFVTLADALAEALFDAIGPAYPDDPNADAEDLFDRYHGREWLTAVELVATKAGERGQQ